MNTSSILRLGGTALIVGGLLQIVGSFVTPTGDPAMQMASPLYTFSNGANLLGGFLAIVGLPAAYARLSRTSGGLGLIGFLGLIGTLLFYTIFFPLMALIVFPWMTALSPNVATAEPPASFFTFFMLAAVFSLVGGIAFGLAVIRSGVFSRWPGYLLLLAGALNLVFQFANIGADGSLLGQLPGVLFNLSIMWVGYELTQVRDRAQVEALPATDSTSSSRDLAA